MSKKGAKKQLAMAATLEEIMRMLMEERTQHETAMARREQQIQQQMMTMHQHMESLLQVVNESTAKIKSQPHRTLDVKLVPLSAKDDIEAYLVTFERMVAHEIRKDQWPYQLAPQLTGKAQLAFAAMSSTEAKDYDAIKAAVLARYDVNKETYR